MVWLVVLAVASGVALIVASVLRGRGFNSGTDRPRHVGVTLSVLPSRTAVVMLDLGADSASGEVGPLVEHAVREAFTFKAVNVVEVRDSDGQLLDRRRRDHVISA